MFILPCIYSKDCNFCVCMHLQDSFVEDAKVGAPKETDIEMGTRILRTNSDLGLETFNKQVMILKLFDFSTFMSVY